MRTIWMLPTHLYNNSMRGKASPQQHAFRRLLVDGRLGRPQQDRVQEERARSARRQRLLHLLYAASHPPNVHVVVPDEDDPLVDTDPLPYTDVDFPVSAVEFWATWRIGVEREPVVDTSAMHTVSDSENDDNDE